MNLRFASSAGLTFLMLASSAAFPQGLADTAKKEQSRRKKAATSGTTKVYTESDLPAPLTGPPVETEGDKTASKTAAPKSSPGSPTIEQIERAASTQYRGEESQLKARVARAEAIGQQLAAHPTGGGRICALPEGVFQPGVTAPEQVVCPYQMETRYDRAKRELETAKAELARFQEMGRRTGMR